VIGCCENLVAVAGNSQGTQRKGNVLRWKPLQSNDSEEMTVDTKVCVIVNCKV
jgi:hypothetical protein